MNFKPKRVDYTWLRERRFNAITRRHGSIRAIQRSISARQNAQFFGVRR